MNALAFASVTFVISLGFAWLGSFIRTVLPPSHLTKESHEVIRLGMGLVATMTALLLGLVTAAAKDSFDTHDVAVKSAAADVLTLDRLLARYGPETQPTREVLRRGLASRLQAMWPENGAAATGLRALETGPLGETTPEGIEDAILKLSPQTEAQQWFKGEALKLTEEVLRTRWRVLGSASSSVPRALLVVVVFWLAMTFGSFGLSAPRNATVMTVFAISAFSVAAALFLILELDGPFDGIVRVSGEPLRYALANLGGK